MYMVDVKNRFGVEQLRNMGCGYAPRSQYWPLKGNEEEAYEAVCIEGFVVCCPALAF